MSEGSPDAPIVFGKRELEPDAMEDYQRKIAEARKTGSVNSLKGNTPLGGVERPMIPLLTRQVDTGAMPAGLTPEGGVQPRPAGSPILSPQTQAQLSDMHQVQEQKAEEEKREDAAKKEEKETDFFDAFDFYGRSESERILNNKKRRMAIESRCAPMDFEDLLMKEEVRQRVPILPGKFEVEFRSLLPSESLFVKQFMVEDSKRPESYYLEKFSLCQLAMAVVAINGKPLGAPHIKSDGEIDEKTFVDNLRRMVKKSGYVVADLSVNYAWFDIRVRKLFNPDDLGNG